MALEASSVRFFSPYFFKEENQARNNRVSTEMSME
jgi:hypothetical protein